MLQAFVYALTCDGKKNTKCFQMAFSLNREHYLSTGFFFVCSAGFGKHVIFWTIIIM